MHKNSSKYLFLFSTLYTLVLLYFSLADPETVLSEDRIPHQDKLMHLVAYVLLAFFWGIYGCFRVGNKVLIITFSATLVFGIVLEAVQEIINSSRTTDVLDLIANCTGVVLGTVFVHYYQKSKYKIT